MSFLQLGLFIVFFVKATSSVAAPSPKGPECLGNANESAHLSMPSCTAAFVASSKCPPCVSVSVELGGCTDKPKAVVSGCLPEIGTVDLGFITVVGEGGTVLSTWKLRSVDGIVEILILDLP